MAVNVMAAIKINIMLPFLVWVSLSVGGQTVSEYWTCSTKALAAMAMSVKVAERVSAICSNIWVRPVLRR